MARILKDYAAVSLKTDKIDGKINFEDVFGRSGPVHIEIGTGRGTFLVNKAKAWLEVNFLGIEWASKFYRYSVDRIGRWGLENVRIIRTDAAAFLADLVPAESVDCFHIYFPDPWPKKRHHKRRFICEANTEELLRCLKVGGVIKIATDHAGYFEQLEKVLNARRDLERIDFLKTLAADQGEWVGTNFERKYLKENRQIYTAAVRKTC